VGGGCEGWVGGGGGLCGLCGGGVGCVGCVGCVRCVGSLLTFDIPQTALVATLDTYDFKYLKVCLK
jgi:hypothetical protein